MNGSYFQEGVPSSFSAVNNFFTGAIIHISMAQIAGNCIIWILLSHSEHWHIHKIPVINICKCLFDNPPHCFCPAETGTQELCKWLWQEECSMV